MYEIFGEKGERVAISWKCSDCSLKPMRRAVDNGEMPPSEIFMLKIVYIGVLVNTFYVGM